jgi:hypothetical protein
MVNRPSDGPGASCVASPGGRVCLASGNSATGWGLPVPCLSYLLAETDLPGEARDPFMPETAEDPATQALLWWPEGDGY